jgi:isoquinoline 1-oxidoreductase beta subunit
MNGALSRGGFIRLTSALGAGLALGVRMPVAAAPEADEAGLAPNAWVRVAPDESVTIYVSKAEMGQGVATGFCTLVSDELDVSLENVKFVFAPVSKVYADPIFGDITTGGSTSMLSSFLPLRKAGATARAMLVQAAATGWGVAPSECTTANGVVTHAASQRHATYGSLVTAAAALPVPSDVALKDPTAFTLIGKPTVQRLDIPPKVNGTARFGIDVTVPGMVYASVEKPPVFGGSVASFDATAAKKVRGVLDVVQISSGVAVVATNTWAAKQGRAALSVKWHDGPNANLSSRELFDQARALVPRAKIVSAKGNVASVTGRTLHATYQGPFLAHAAMEPMNATASVRADGVDVWAPTQVASRCQSSAMRISGLPADRCLVHTTLLGGGFGRKLEVDAVEDALEVSKAVGKPVKVTYTREDDVQHDFYRPSSVNAVSGTLDDGGNLIALVHTVVAPSIAHRWLPVLYNNGIDPLALDGVGNVAYAVPNTEVRYADQQHGIPVGFMRAPAANFNTFATEGFMDELAHAAGKDPLAFRLALLTQDPRATAVLKTAAGKAGYGKKMPPGRAQGIALGLWGGSYGALVADVSLQDKNVKVHHVTVAVDCGTVVNPDIVQTQVSGAVLYGLAMARTGKITIKDGRVEQHNFYDYVVLRHDDAPRVDVTIVASSVKPTGIGELGVPAIAPAVASAVFTLTGKRIRTLPFSDALA